MRRRRRKGFVAWSLQNRIPGSSHLPHSLTVFKYPCLPRVLPKAGRKHSRRGVCQCLQTFRCHVAIVQEPWSPIKRTTLAACERNSMLLPLGNRAAVSTQLFRDSSPDLLVSRAVFHSAEFTHFWFCPKQHGLVSTA